MKIKFNTLLLTAALTASMNMTAFAGTWQQDITGWWYQNDDGSYLNNGWSWIDGRCYYFMPDGYCLSLERASMDFQAYTLYLFQYN